MAENTGTWLDTQTGQVVTTRPVEGVQLVSPEVEPTAADEAVVAEAKALAAEPAEVEAAPAETSVVSTEDVAPADTPTDTPADTVTAVDEVAEDGRPAGNASTEEWRAYAVAQGLAEDDVAAMGRDEIRDHFA